MRELDSDVSRSLFAVQGVHRNLVEKYVGKTARITVDFHDQPYGKSKPNLCGKTYLIDGVYLDTDEVSFSLKGVLCTVRPEQIEVLP